MTLRSRDPVLSHCKLVEALLESPQTMTDFFMTEGSSHFRDIPGGPEIGIVVGDGPFRRLKADASLDRAIGL